MEQTLTINRINSSNGNVFIAYLFFFLASAISLSFFWYSRLIGHITWGHILLILITGSLLPIFSSYVFILNTRNKFFRTHLLWLIRTYWYGLFYALALFVFSWIGFLYMSETSPNHPLDIISLVFREGFTLGAAALTIWYFYRQLWGFSMLLIGQTPHEQTIYSEEEIS